MEYAQLLIELSEVLLMLMFVCMCAFLCVCVYVCVSEAFYRAIVLSKVGRLF